MTDTDTDGRGAVQRAARADLCAGGAFIALGLAFVVGSLDYDRGTAFNMGPAYVPQLLGGLLAALGVAVLVPGVLALTGSRTPAEADPDVPTSEPPGPVPWLRGALLVGAILVFGLTIDGLGIGGALLVTTFMAAMAGHRNTVVKSAIIAVGLTVFCVVVFVYVLQLRLPVLGEWLGG